MADLAASQQHFLPIVDKGVHEGEDGEEVAEAPHEDDQGQVGQHEQLHVLDLLGGGGKDENRL